MQPELSERAACVADCGIVSPMHAQNLREKRSDVYVHWAAVMIDCLVYVNKAQLLVLLSKALSHSDASAPTISKARETNGAQLPHGSFAVFEGIKSYFS